MATVNDALIIELKAEISGLKTGIATATSEIQKFSSVADKGVERVRASTIALGVGFAMVAREVVGFSISMGKSIVSVGMDMQSLNNKMRASVGDTQAAAVAMGFIREESSRLGLNFMELADSFASFSASAMRNGFTLRQSEEVFSGVSEALTALQVPTQQVGLAFLALEQMAGKGVIQLQEVRQLVNAVPGALELMAQAMGVSTSQFNDMISKGSVLASDLLPKLGAEFRRQFGSQAAESAKSAQAEFNRLNNALMELKATAANGGLLDGVTQSVRELTKSLQSEAMKDNVKWLIGALGEIVKLSIAAANFVGALGRKITGNTSNMMSDAELGQQALKDYIAKHGGNAATLDKSLGGGVQAGSSGGVGGDMKSEIDSLRFQLASETEQLALEHDKRQQLLEKALKQKQITEEQYRELSFQSELDYKNKFAELWAKQAEERQSQEDEVSKTVNSLRQGAVDKGIAFLEVFGQKNKAAAMAQLVISKGLAAAQAIVSGYAGAAKAMEIYGPTPQGFAAAESSVAYGYLNAALIGATALASAAMGGGGGGKASGASSSSSSSTGASDGSGGAVQSTPAPKSVNINIQGEMFGPRQMRELVNGLNTYLGDGTLKLNVTGSIA